MLCFFPRHLFCIDLFQLPYELNRDVSSLLLSAEKMDRDFKINVSQLGG